MTKHNNGYTGHFLVAGVAALVASSIVALGSFSRAQVTQAQIDSCKVTCEADTDLNMPNPKDCAGWCQDGDYKSAPPVDAAPPITGTTDTAPAQASQCDWSQMPQDATCMWWECTNGSFSCGERRPADTQQSQPQQQWGGDRCSQIHSATWGDRCAKERALLESQCVQDISPECGGRRDERQPGPWSGGQDQWRQGPQDSGPRIEIHDNIATCFSEGDRWTQDQNCQREAAARGLIQQHGAADDGSRMGGFQKKCDSRYPPSQEECPNAFCTEDGRWECGRRGGQGNMMGGPRGMGGMMGPGRGGQMGPGGFPGMGGQMGPGMMGPGGPGGGMMGGGQGMMGGGMGGPGGEELEMMVAKITRSPIAIKMFTKKVTSSIKRDRYHGEGELTAWQAMLEAIQENVRAIIEKFTATKPSVAKKYQKVLPTIDNALSVVETELEAVSDEGGDDFDSGGGGGFGF